MAGEVKVHRERSFQSRQVRRSKFDLDNLVSETDEEEAARCAYASLPWRIALFCVNPTFGLSLEP